MAGAEAPEIFSGWQQSVTADGTEIGSWVSDISYEAEDDVQEFQGSNGSAKARVVSGRTLSFTFTVGNHPTPMSILEPAYYNADKPPVTFVVTEYDGRVITIVATISHLTYQGGSGDIKTVDVETLPRSFAGMAGV